MEGNIENFYIPPVNLKPLKVLVVDDSITVRTRIVNVLECFAESALLDTAPTLDIAKRKAALSQPDIIYIDLEMRGVTVEESMTALKAASAQSYFIALTEVEGDRLTFHSQYRSLGCAEGLRKNDDFVQQLVHSYRDYLGRKGRSTIMSRNPDDPAALGLNAFKPTLIKRPKKIDIVAIGVSTGGPVALNEVIPKLPADLGVPVVMVQHMPSGFTKPLAEGLQRISKIQVKEGKDKEFVQPNTVYIAPGGCHMALGPARIKPAGMENVRAQILLNDEPPENSCKPSVDTLFRSVSRVYKDNILAVIMTGMGYDGRRGVKIIKDNGSALCLSQTENTCVVYGMPAAVDEAGLSDEHVPLGQLAERITALVKRKFL